MSDTDLIREALGAYASALRSGESESERMRVLHAQALAALARVDADMAAKDAALQWLAIEWAKYAESEGTERLGPYPDPSPDLVRGIIEQALALPAVLGKEEEQSVNTERIIDRAVIVEDADGQYRVRAESSNGDLILWSEKYRDLAWARAVAADLGVPVELKLSAGEEKT